MDIENPQAQIEYFLREIKEGRLVEVCRCEYCFYFEDGRYCSHSKGLAETDKNGYCQHAERKEKTDG